MTQEPPMASDAQVEAMAAELYRRKWCDAPFSAPKPAHREPYAAGGNRASAHARIHHRVKLGELPHPRTLPCADCGHLWSEGERRHEYDHIAGYSRANALLVEPVCTLCHHRRGRERGTHIRKRGSNGRFIGGD